MTECGETIYYRAHHHAGRWEFFSTLKSDPEWNVHDTLPLDVMEEFREVLWKKHIRRRVPLKQVEEIDALIADLRISETQGFGD